MQEHVGLQLLFRCVGVQALLKYVVVVWTLLEQVVPHELLDKMVLSMMFSSNAEFLTVMILL